MRRTVFLGAILGMTAIVAACAADSTGPGAGRQNVTVSFSAGTAAAASLSDTSSALRSITATSGTDVLVINKAQVVVARMELEPASGVCNSDEDAGDDHPDEHECEELALAPTIVDVPVTGSMITALSVTVPAGTYSKLDAKIRPVKGKGTASTAFLAAHPEFTNVSVRIEGTFNGKPFTFVGSPHAEFETRFNPPVVIADKGVNLTVHVDAATWFKTSSGTLIDPTNAAAGTSANAIIAANIARSFRAFHDDNRDDHDDDGGR